MHAVLPGEPTNLFAESGVYVGCEDNNLDIGESPLYRVNRLVPIGVPTGMAEADAEFTCVVTPRYQGACDISLALIAANE